jgi:hypothetical protein
MTSLSSKTSLIAMSVLALACTQGVANAAATSAPGGLYVGYYQEDPLTNPEDPTPGAFVLNLPENDASFNGDMYFTYVGCQHNNVGKVKGVKAGLALSGSWSGTVDASPQSGPYKGTYDPASGYYKGVYTASGGKQFKNIQGCIQYYIAPNGTWEMFAVEQNQPAAFKVNIAGSKVSWAAVPGAAMTLVYVLDPAVAKAGGGNPVKFQTLIPGNGANFNFAPIGLNKGKEYIAVALVSNKNAARVAFASKRFVAP